MVLHRLAKARGCCNGESLPWGQSGQVHRNGWFGGRCLTPGGNSGDRNSPNPGPGQLGDRLPRLPSIERNEEFAARIARLARAYEFMNSGSPAGMCTFQSEEHTVHAPPCRPPLRPGKDTGPYRRPGTCQVFPRDLRNVKINSRERGKGLLFSLLFWTSWNGLKPTGPQMTGIRWVIALCFSPYLRTPAVCRRATRLLPPGGPPSRPADHRCGRTPSRRRC